MKRGFTLVEMLIVVVVLVTLMTITFRLSSVGNEQEARSTTVARMQRLENCLSGYYAAFGSYPPVPLHGSRNIYLKVNGQGIQNSDGDEGRDLWGWTAIGETKEEQAWAQVEAACLAQPVACEFPFQLGSGNRNASEGLVKQLSDRLSKYANSGKDKYKYYWQTPEKKAKYSAGFDDLVSENSGRLGNLEDSDWRNIQLFKFGVMSFLLPRYLVMMGSDDKFYRSNCAQWCSNNTLPTDALTGDAFNSWNDVKEYAIRGEESATDYARVANIPSQAVCARWLPNLAENCACNHDLKLMGITISGGGSYSFDDYIESRERLKIYSPNSGNGGENYSSQYILDGITVIDGWRHDFYYYSAPPYQSYQLWSAGANGRTFPPWLDRKSMDSQANRCIGLWIEDDINQLSN